MCRVTRRGQQAQDLQRGIADLETNPNTCRQDCHPAPHRGLHSSRQREQETWSQQQQGAATPALRCAALIYRCNRGHFFLEKCHVLYKTTPLKKNDLPMGEQVSHVR